MNTLIYIIISITLVFLPIRSHAIETSQSNTKHTLKNLSIQVQDFENNTVILASPAKRIIALAPHIVENLFTLGLGQNIVAAVAHSDFPEAAKSLPSIGDYNGYSIEKIVSLKPDIVIAWSSGTNLSIIEKLRALNIPIYLDNPKTLHQIEKSLIDFATLAGLDSNSLPAKEQYSKKIRHLTQTFKNKTPISVFIPIGENPLRTLSGKHVVSDLINNCSGYNIFSDLATIAPTINYESVLKRAPQVILVGAKNTQTAEASLRNLKLPFIQTQIKDHGRASHKQQPYTVVIDPDILYRHSVRMADAMEILCEEIEEVRITLNPLTQAH